MAGLENERDVNDIDDDEEELEQSSEPSAELADPQAPVEIETDEQKRANRLEKRRERRSHLENTQRERDQYRAELEAMRRQPSYQAPQQQQVHPVAAKLKSLDEREARLFKEYETVASRAGYDRNGQEEANYQRMARELQVERMITVSQAAAPQVNEEEIIRKINWRNFTTENADVHGADGNTPAWRWALARHAQMVAEGQADTKELAYGILDQARRRFGLKPRNGTPAPTAADKQRFSGISSRAGASGGGEGKVQMGPNEKRMARIMCEGRKVNGKDMTEPQMYQYWANTIGKKLQAEKGKGG